VFVTLQCARTTAAVLTSYGMPNHTNVSASSFDLAASARAEMIREGFHIGEPEGADEQVAQIRQALLTPPPGLRDLSALLWSSIDNDTSRDLDQIEYAEQTSAGIRVLIGIADVAAAVAKDTPLDRAAAAQTQTVYTAVENFPMLPFELSTDLTSLNPDQPRQAIICEFTVGEDGTLSQQAIYPALALNRAQLAYSTAGPFLEGQARPDGRHDPQLDDPILAAQMRVQGEAAQHLHRNRVQLGALDFNRVEADPVVIDGKVQAIQAVAHNRASDLIENLMIAANETMAMTLRNSNRSAIRRVVRSPERWDRIVALVATKGGSLPAQPDSHALNTFLEQQRASDSVHYPDLALAIIKLMGPGEYVLSKAGDPEPPGHFSLAALDYTHSTAPNRRFADLVTQRIVKAMLADELAPYTDDELAALAQHINGRDSAARKVERTMQKRVAAVALAPQVGQQFRGVITGATAKGTFVRVFNPPVEGRILKGFEGLDVGDQVTVTLSGTDPLHAFIDFTRP
jgi:VacB/RNase II family 3'-5' exoribonuclease